MITLSIKTLLITLLILLITFSYISALLMRHFFQKLNSIYWFSRISSLFLRCSLSSLNRLSLKTYLSAFISCFHINKRLSVIDGWSLKTSWVDKLNSDTNKKKSWRIWANLSNYFCRKGLKQSEYGLYWYDTFSMISFPQKIQQYL